MIVDDYMRVLRTVTPHRVIPAFDNGPRPARPYLSVSVLDSKVGGIHRGRVLDVDRTNSQHRSVTLRVEIFGDDAWEIASEIDASIFDEQAIDVAAEVYGIAWQGSGRLMDVPQLRDKGGYEPRVVLEIPSCYTAHHVEHTGAIEQVEGEMRTAPGVSALRQFVAGVLGAAMLVAAIGSARAAGRVAVVTSATALESTTGAALAAGRIAQVASSVVLASGIGRAAAVGRVAGVANTVVLDSTVGVALAKGIAAGISSPVALESVIGQATAAGRGAEIASAVTLAPATGSASAAGHAAAIASAVVLEAATGAALAVGHVAEVASAASITPAAHRGIASTTYAGGRTNTVVPVPAEVVDGDMLVMMHVALSTEAIAAPAGWTLVAGFPASVAAGATATTRLWWRVASSEPANYTVNHGSISSQGLILAVSGAKNSAPAATVATGVGVTTTAPGLTAQAGALVAFIAHNWELYSFGGLPPAGTTPVFTERLDGASTLVYVADGVMQAPGSTGAKTQANGNTDAGAWTGILVAFEPA